MAVGCGIIASIMANLANNDTFFLVLAIGAFVLGLAWGIINRQK